MPPNAHTFLFSPPDDISPLTSRRVHLRRLYDVLHLSILRGDLHRARCAWAILARCKEINWRTSWMLATALLDCSERRIDSNQTKIDLLRAMTLHSPEDREPILCELVHSYIVAGRHREALDELEFSLPSFPYRDNTVLHIYAGICSVLAAQLGSTGELDGPAIDSEMLGRAQIFFERAKSLDPENIVVDSLLGMVRMFFETCYNSLNILMFDEKTQNLAQGPTTLPQTEVSDDEGNSGIELARIKRLRA